MPLPDNFNSRAFAVAMGERLPTAQDRADADTMRDIKIALVTARDEIAKVGPLDTDRDDIRTPAEVKGALDDLIDEVEDTACKLETGEG